jgi:hypothetical protein
MAKKAKRLVSESRTQLIDCRRLLHIVLFRRALAHFPQSPDLTAPASQRSYSSYARHPLRALDTICGRECPGRYKLAFNFVRGRSCLHHRLTRPFIRYARP